MVDVNTKPKFPDDLKASIESGTTLTPTVISGDPTLATTAVVPSISSSGENMQGRIKKLNDMLTQIIGQLDKINVSGDPGELATIKSDLDRYTAQIANITTQIDALQSFVGFSEPPIDDTELKTTIDKVKDDDFKSKLKTAAGITVGGRRRSQRRKRLTHRRRRARPHHR